MDIDLDFDDARREEVIEYCRQKYGYDCVSRIITFGTMAAKQAVLDVARIYEYPVDFARKITKTIPSAPKTTLKKAMEESSEFCELYNTDADAKKIIDMAMKLEGLVKSTGVHACGLLVSSIPISDYAPVQYVLDNKTGKVNAVACFTMSELEAVGGLKMDFLGLKTESVINESLQDIATVYGDEYSLYDIPLQDVAVYQSLGEGKTAGSFQLESSGMTGVITQMYQDLDEKVAEIQELPENEQKTAMENLGKQCFERLCCAISLYRPGPMDEIPNYIAAMMDESKIRYDTPALEPILKNTYGVLVYQEQVMQTVKALAGFTSGQADLIRKASATRFAER